MLTALRRHHGRRDDEGFTLIEIMVVVLVIGILLAIAIPTFSGAEQRANDRSAQSNLRNALTAEKVLYTDVEAYADTSAAVGQSAMAVVEPSLTWVAAGSSYASRAVSATVSTTALVAVTLADQSATGTCWFIVDVAVPSNLLGTYYAQNKTCIDPAPPTSPVSQPLSSTTVDHWALAF